MLTGKDNIISDLEKRLAVALAKNVELVSEVQALRIRVKLLEQERRREAAQEAEALLGSPVPCEAG